MLRTTGRFRVSDQSDHDGTGPDSEPGSTPPFPGQDFLTSLDKDLSSGEWEVMITIEPDPDPMPLVPTALRVLRAKIPVDQGPSLSIALQNIAQSEQLARVDITVRR